MRAWDAFSQVMGTSRRRRIGSREAEQLLASGDSAYPELSHLLAAAAAPPRRDELVGLGAAVAAFEAAGPGDGAVEVAGRAGGAVEAVGRAGGVAEAAGRAGGVVRAAGPGDAVVRTVGRDGGSIDAAGRRGAVVGAVGRDGGSGGVAGGRRVGARSVLVKAAAGVAMVLFGGTALAAETGSLPGGVQQHAYRAFSVLGVPPPGGAPATSAAPAGAAPPSPAPTSGRPTATPKPAGAEASGLCRSWAARQKNPKKKPMKADALATLNALAGGADQVAAFCAPLLVDGKGKTTTPTPSTAVPTTSHPGKDKVHKTPKPHKTG